MGIAPESIGGGIVAASQTRSSPPPSRGGSGLASVGLGAPEPESTIGAMPGFTAQRPDQSPVGQQTHCADESGGAPSPASGETLAAQPALCVESAVIDPTSASARAKRRKCPVVVGVVMCGFSEEAAMSRTCDRRTDESAHAGTIQTCHQTDCKGWACLRP